MKTKGYFRILPLVAALALGSLAAPANAIPITGGIGFGGLFTPTGGADLGSATGISIGFSIVQAATGAFEHLPYVQVANLARALDNLKQADFRCLGLAAEAESTLAAVEIGERLVLVLGGEERGLRRLTRERCDHLVRLPTGGPIGQLNVSAAAPLALYEILRSRAD